MYLVLLYKLNIVIYTIFPSDLNDTLDAHRSLAPGYVCSHES